MDNNRIREASVFPLLVVLFSNSPKMPRIVEIYTNSKFDQHDSALVFVKIFVQDIRYESLRSPEKKAVTVSIKNLTILHNQFIKYKKLGRPNLAKHLKNTLQRSNLSILKTKDAMVERGIVLNIEKLKLICQYNPIELSS